MENQSTKEPRGEEVERELKHRERNHDEDLTCRPQAEMNALPLEELPPFPCPPTHLPSSALLAVHSPSLTSALVAPSSCSCAKFSAKRALSLCAYMLSGRRCSTLHCTRQFGSTDVGDSEGAER